MFLPSIQTSDHGIELIVIEHSPPPPESSVATDFRGAGVSSTFSSVTSSLPVSRRTFFGLPVPGVATTPPPPGTVAGPPVGLVPPPACLRGGGPGGVGGGGCVGGGGVVVFPVVVGDTGVLGVVIATSLPVVAGGEVPSGAAVGLPLPAPPIIGIRTACALRMSPGEMSISVFHG